MAMSRLVPLLEFNLLSAFVRLSTRIDERPQLDWSGVITARSGALADAKLGETRSSCIFCLFLNRINGAPQEPRSPGRTARIAFLPIRGSSAAQLFA